MRTKLVAALLAIGCTGTAQAAEKIRYEKIPARLARFRFFLQGRSFKVTTLDGTMHVGATLSVMPESARLYQSDGSSEEIAGEEITRIEIKLRGHASDFSSDCALLAVELPFACASGDALSCVLTPVISPVALAVAAASAPFTLAVDGVTLMFPPKVY